jgi:V/A-type H+-transporting ATPase subunit A
MADSTSRWAEALREISGRLGEMPIEEGFPAYLPSRLAAFYERSGRVETLAGEEGSVTVIGAVSPPGGDFSEPVSRHTQRFTRCWWALDRDLAHKRHYPAVSWLSSYSLQLEEVSQWWNEKAGEPWQELRSEAMNILHEESSLQQLAQLVGPDALSDAQQWILAGARMLREGFLQQNALNPVDAYSVPEKQLELLKLLLRVYRRGRKLLDAGMSVEEIREKANLPRLLRLKDEVANDDLEQLEQAGEEVLGELGSLGPGPEGEPTEQGEGGRHEEGS